ncbi:MAG: exodeoxyribonuclease VII large subunit, partial [Candidatus Omnitrophica bacterium]|nr:exodeoxyribonuclease VII large subunit [Candidatus Omnitrophota bacterium]
HGRISVYAPRGQYQLIVDAMEPAGVGQLQLAFEALKKKLGEEGLFDVARKKPLPYLPELIAVITSPSGAVIHDIQRVLFRRFPEAHLLVVPVAVQGDGAPDEIVAAIRAVNEHAKAEVIIVARGGGSLEDLWAFNDERVARAIAVSGLYDQRFCGGFEGTHPVRRGGTRSPRKKRALRASRGAGEGFEAGAREESR